MSKKKKENNVLGPEELREVYLEQLDKPKSGVRKVAVITAFWTDCCRGGWCMWRLTRVSPWQGCLMPWYQNIRELLFESRSILSQASTLSHCIHILNDRYVRAELSIIDIKILQKLSGNLFYTNLEAKQGPNCKVWNTDLQYPILHFVSPSQSSSYLLGFALPAQCPSVSCTRYDLDRN